MSESIIDKAGQGATWIWHRTLGTIVTLAGAGAAGWGMSHVDMSPLPQEAAWVIPAAIGMGVVNAVVNKGPTLLDKGRLFITGLAASAALYGAAKAGHDLVPVVERGQTTVDQLDDRVNYQLDELAR